MAPAQSFLKIANDTLREHFQGFGVTEIITTPIYHAACLDTPCPNSFTKKHEYWKLQKKQFKDSFQSSCGVF
jgi:hypothetical protein